MSALLCRIRVEGRLRLEWSEWFDGMEIAYDGADTLLCGQLPDQAALYGQLNKLRDLGLALVAVETTKADSGGRISS
jgi:hypothetical protein